MDPKPKNKKKLSELANTLTAYREKAGMSVRELAEASGITLEYVMGYESGLHKPTPLMLGRLTQALGIEDLAARFPAHKPIPASQMAGAKKWPLRVQHLIVLTAQGRQSWFAYGVGLSGGSISGLVNGRKENLSEIDKTKLLTALPGLSEAWLLTGNGSPFPDGETPIFGPGPKHALKSAQAPAPPAPPRQLSFPLLPLVDPGEEWMSPSKYVSKKVLLARCSEQVGLLVENGCGMTPHQVETLLTVLRKLA